MSLFCVSFSCPGLDGSDPNPAEGGRYNTCRKNIERVGVIMDDLEKTKEQLIEEKNILIEVLSGVLDFMMKYDKYMEDRMDIVLEVVKIMDRTNAQLYPQENTYKWPDKRKKSKSVTFSELK